MEHVVLCLESCFSRHLPTEPQVISLSKVEITFKAWVTFRENQQCWQPFLRDGSDSWVKASHGQWKKPVWKKDFYVYNVPPMIHRHTAQTFSMKHGETTLIFVGRIRMNNNYECAFPDVVQYRSSDVGQNAMRLQTTKLTPSHYRRLEVFSKQIITTQTETQRNSIPCPCHNSRSTSIGSRMKNKTTEQ